MIILIVGFSPQDAELAVQTALQKLMQAGYIINLTKSDLTPLLHLVYIGERFCMHLAWIFLLGASQEGCSDLLFPVILQGGLLQVSTSVSLLVVPHAHLRMRPIQWYLKYWWSSCLSLAHLVLVNSDFVQDLQWWMVE